MNRWTQAMWALSALLLAWIGAMAVVSGYRKSCSEAGQNFEVSSWSCVPGGPPIILQRDIQRG
jgi:hypothetical protein